LPTAGGLSKSHPASGTSYHDEARCQRSRIESELAADDFVDCSVGFGVEAESWPQNDLRLVREAWLDHVALTSQPAYRDAKVLGVRAELADVG
jgi:phage head maturation protease